MLSLVPYVGLPLAMMPPLFSALGINTVPVYILVVVSVAVLHLLALNLLYPKIVGSRVHLNPLVVTFSLMLWVFCGMRRADSGDSADGGAESGLRQRERAAADRQISGRLTGSLCGELFFSALPRSSP